MIKVHRLRNSFLFSLFLFSTASTATSVLVGDIYMVVFRSIQLLDQFEVRTSFSCFLILLFAALYDPKKTALANGFLNSPTGSLLLVVNVAETQLLSLIRIMPDYHIITNFNNNGKIPIETFTCTTKVNE